MSARRPDKQCTHHWLLHESSMKQVRAVCRRCGAQRGFPSVLTLPQTLVGDERGPVFAAELSSVDAV